MPDTVTATHHGRSGRFYINKTESLTVEELKQGFKLAVSSGLQLAIINSCDGLGIARQLEDLGIPQTIVMREPVCDRVAQDFLKYFLQPIFAAGNLCMWQCASRGKDWQN